MDVAGGVIVVIFACSVIVVFVTFGAAVVPVATCSRDIRSLHSDSIVTTGREWPTGEVRVEDVGAPGQDRP